MIARAAARARVRLPYRGRVRGMPGSMLKLTFATEGLALLFLPSSFFPSRSIHFVIIFISEPVRLKRRQLLEEACASAVARRCSQCPPSATRYCLKGAFRIGAFSAFICPPVGHEGMGDGTGRDGVGRGEGGGRGCVYV